MAKEEKTIIDKAKDAFGLNEKTKETLTKENPKSKRVEKNNPTLEDGWEIKDRIYRLRGSKRPLSRSVKSANIHWFDEEKGYERELKYCQNQDSFC